MRFKTLAMCAAVAILPGGAALSAPVRPAVHTARGWTIPYISTMGLVLVPMSINGEKPELFDFDTGEAATLIDASYAAKIGLVVKDPQEMKVPGGTIHVGAIPDVVVRFPTVAPTKLTLTAAPLAPFSKVLGVHFAGIIGHDLIKQYSVKIDYEHKTITFWKPDEFSYSGTGDVVPIKIEDDQIFLPVTVKPTGQEPVVGKFKLDTGGVAGGMNNNFVRDAHILGPQSKTVTAQGLALGGDTKGGQVLLDWVKVGPTTFTHAVMGYTTDSAGFENRSDAGTIGAELIAHFNLYLDYARNRVIFERRGPAEQHAFNDEVGATLGADGDDLSAVMVQAAIPGSPAAEAGLQPNDQVVSINGKAPRSLDDAWEAFHSGRELNVKLRRADGDHVVVIHPRPLIAE